MITRRSFLKATSLLGCSSLALGTSALGSVKNSSEDLTLSKLEINIPSLPVAFDGFRIGMLSDPHLGTCSNGSLLKRAIDLLSSEKLDLLVLAGDYVLVLDLFASRFFYNHFSQSSYEQICSKTIPTFEESLAQGEYFFKQVALEATRLNPKHGIVAVLGNHDRWNSADNCCSILGNSGIKMLLNSSITVSSSGSELEIYGCDDYSTGIPQAPEPTKTTRILVSHNPDFLSELAESGTFDLGLAGHTHGGQINLPALGPVALNIKDSRLIQGLISLNGTQIFVSRGIGTSGLPWRLNCPPEVNLLTLRSREAQATSNRVSWA